MNHSITECTNVAGEKLAIGRLQTIGRRPQRNHHDFSYTRDIRLVREKNDKEEIALTLTHRMILDLRK